MTEEHSLFPAGSVFSVFVCWNGNSNTQRGRKAQLGQGGRPGAQHPAVRSREPAPCVLDSNHLKLLFGPVLCPAVIYHQVGWNTLDYKERYSKWPREPLLQRICSKQLVLVLLAYMLSLHENKIIVYKRNTFWIHRGKTFGFKGSKEYCSLIKVSIDSKTLNMYLGAWNLKPSQILTSLSKNPIQKQQKKLNRSGYLGCKSTLW